MKKEHNLLPCDGEVFYYPSFFSPLNIDSFAQKIKWERPPIKLFGKEHLTPRLVCWMAEQKISYKYSGIELPIHQWNEDVLVLKEKIETNFLASFNGVLLNYYQHGKHYMGMHSDNEKSLGDRPLIASVSFGESRVFVFKHKKLDLKYEITLEDSSLLIMRGETQNFWNHGLKKEKKKTLPRLNMTFRKVL